MNLLIRAAGVARHDHGVHGPGRIKSDQTVASQQAGHARRFRGDETHAVVAVAAQKPLHRPVAEPAVAIVDHEQAAPELRKVAHTPLDDRGLAPDAGQRGSATILNK